MTTAVDEHSYGEPREGKSDLATPQPSYQPPNSSQTPTLPVDDLIRPQTGSPTTPATEMVRKDKTTDVPHLGVPQSRAGGVVPQGPTYVTIGDPNYVTPLDRLDESPEWIDCPFCRRRTKTVVSQESSTATTLAGVLCCLVTLIGACIPCLCGWCSDTDHRCSECKNRVTHKPHDGPIQVMSPQKAGQIPSKYAYSNPGYKAPTEKMQSPSQLP